MTDPTTSGASAETPFGTFGSTRGSGLARGKRVTPVAASAAAAAPGSYRPTSLQVITPASEYRNPFASDVPAGESSPSATVEAPRPEAAASPVPSTAFVPEAPVSAPRAAAPAVLVREEPVEPSAPAPRHAVAAEISSEAAAGMSTEPAPASESERAEIRILPAAESRRPAVSWEGASASPERAAESSERPRRDERPVFRPESRRDGPAVERSEGREPRRDFGRGADSRPAARDRAPQPLRPTPAREAREPQAQPPRARGGFFGWLKGLFGGKSNAASAARAAVAGEAPRDDDRAVGREGGQPGQHPRRRRRGGRGQGFTPGGRDSGPHGSHGGHSGEAGPREGTPFRRDQADGGGEDRAQSGDAAGGPRRRRHRGGRGRNRGGDHRPEGQKGGGAI
jgi:translation initiation factor IF-2